MKRGSSAKEEAAARRAYARAARRMELDLIRERLARKPEDFLRVRLPNGASTL